jgi:LCP family protein required for cell wall assembly
MDEKSNRGFQPSPGLNQRRPHMPSPQQYLASLEADQIQQPYGPSKPKRAWIKKLVVVGLLIAFLMLAYTVINFLRLSANPFSFGALKGEKEGRINVLLLGVGDPGHAGQNLSDTNLVVSINTRDKQMALISVPRDLRVSIPGFGYGKINQAHSNGGASVSKQVVEQTLGIPIHYYARANFTGLKEAVDAVGGVEIDVKETLYDPEYPCEKNQYRSCGMTIRKGRQQMNGETALRYVRCRKGNCGDDFGRALRQQEVLLAVRQKALSAGTLLNPVKLNELSTALGDNIETDLSVNNAISLAKIAREIPSGETFNIVFSLEPGGFLASRGGDLVPEAGSYGSIQAFTKEVFRLGPIWSENPNIVIENGTSTAGLAGKLRDRIVNEGYRINILRLTNALADSQASQIIDYSGGKKPHTVRYFESILGVTSARSEQLNSQNADVKIILGSDFEASVTQVSQ